MLGNDRLGHPEGGRGDARIARQQARRGGGQPMPNPMRAERFAETQLGGTPHQPGNALLR
jgi:hypothetical protein